LQRRAQAQEAKLQGFWAEFQGLPSKAQSYNARIAAVEQQRKELAMLDLAFEGTVVGSLTNPQYNAKRDALAGRLAMRQQHLTILESAETEARGEIKHLENRNRTLSKILGQPPHKLN
jgi:hypothetical protein